MFHRVGYNNPIVLGLWSETELGYTVQGYELRYAGKTSLYACGVPGRGASAMWSMPVVGDATSCEVLGVIA
jgi:hypothetical protein